MSGIARPAVDKDLWKRIRKLAIDLDTDASEIVELGAKIVIAVLEAGYVPDDLGYLLEKRAPGVADRLRELLAAARAVTQS